MIRLTLRQFRTQAAVAVGLLAVAAVLLGATGAHLAHLYDGYGRALASCLAAPSCQGVQIKISHLDKQLELVGTALVAVPGLIGAFWGAPLITRELENGTHRLAWTQSITRTRWLATKLALVGAASVVATALLSLMVTWWSSPIDRAGANRFNAGLFGERNIAPLGYAAFGFALGVAAGVLIRRTLPAMAATLVVFLGARMSFTYLARPHLISPRHSSQPLNAATTGFGSSNNGPLTLFPGSPNLPGAWIYSSRIVDAHGHGLSPQSVANACPGLAQSLASPPPVAAGPVAGPAPAATQDALHACVAKLGLSYHQVVTYQPANRYWPFQWYETAIFLVAAGALVALCFYWIRRRTS